MSGSVTILQEAFKYQAESFAIFYCDKKCKNYLDL